MTLTTLCKEAHSNAVEKGFYEGKNSERSFAELCMLVVTEISEAVESQRSGKNQPSQYDMCYYADHADFNDKDVCKTFKENVKDSLGDEIADAVIRIADLCGYMGIDLESHVKAKMKYNSTREKLHGKKY